ncbi:GTP-binding protein [Methylococcus sp. EFPC2]|uniref:GTP-binding protein n=1 Tax=Methylococcus sp. EFPC2 TaxID=2812648 RepID=UPI0019684715|nr:GTP-binding protein [Methylococcus sp. EFPC2]QSA95468.1 hypothetical protein JWZ97_09360 [Methylococcus sp. EFPC2]
MQSYLVSPAESRAPRDPGRHGGLTIELISLPGAGKTTLIEATIARLNSRVRVGVIGNELAASDAGRETSEPKPENPDLTLIESRGDPNDTSGIDPGKRRTVVLLSVTDGDDRPDHHLKMVATADVVIVSKAELLRSLPGFSLDSLERRLRGLGCKAMIMPLSAKSGLHLDEWLNWLETELAVYRQSPADSRRDF